MNALKNWFSKDKKRPWFVGGTVVALLLVVLLGSGGGGYLSGSAGAACDYGAIPLDTETTRWGMVVVGNGMNVRGEPSATAAEVGRIARCTIFEVKGRTADAQWLVVQAQGTNLEGWVKNGEDFTGKWLYYRSDLSVISISNNVYAGSPSSGSGSGFSGNGSGGPLPDNYVSIWSNTISTGKITGLPANQSCTVTLAPAGSSSKAVVIWQGTTAGDGTVSFQSSIPTAWADGTNVQSGSLTITFTAGGTSRSWSLYYQK